MNPNNSIQSRRLILFTIAGIAIIFLVYLTSTEAADCNSFTAPSANENSYHERSGWSVETEGS